MTKKTPEELALEAYLAGLTGKKASVSDNRLIATNNRSDEWHKKTAERNRRNATNVEINKKIGDAHRGKKVSKESIEKRINTWRKNGNKAFGGKGSTGYPAWNKGKELSEEHKKNLSDSNKGKKKKDSIKSRLQITGAKCKAVSIPEGIFWSRTLAAKYIFNNNLTNLKTWQSVGVWLSRKLNNHSDTDYKFISQEEYIMLTGEDPFNE